MSRVALVLCFLAVSAGPAAARAEALPVVEDVDWGSLRGRCRVLLEAAEKLKVALPAETVKALRALLGRKATDDPRGAARAAQKLLDPHCLVGVNINPESRVKAARGPARAELVLDRAVYALVKVHNDGGVTHPLSVSSPNKVGKGTRSRDRWLELAVVDRKPFARRLSGGKVEYRLLELTARASGKREATLVFDVGQGSQDLGFRAEVPILFTVRPR